MDEYNIMADQYVEVLRKTPGIQHSIEVPKTTHEKLETECKEREQPNQRPPLPKWIMPDMVYPKSSVIMKGPLGNGQYGIVQKGLLYYSNAV